VVGSERHQSSLQETIVIPRSYEEVLSSPDVDAVYLPLPTATHLGWVKKAAAHKKHILLEKPIALVSRPPPIRCGHPHSMRPPPMSCSHHDLWLLQR